MTARYYTVYNTNTGDVVMILFCTPDEAIPNTPEWCDYIEGAYPPNKYRIIDGIPTPIE